MKTREWLAWLICAFLVVLLYLAEPERETIVIPPRVNTKVITTPSPIVRKDTLVLSGGKMEIVTRRNPVDSLLLARYRQAQDSLQKLQMYKEAITVRDYVEKLEDSVQTITVESRVTGTLNRQSISYKTKPMIIERESRKLKSFGVGSFALLPTQPNQTLTLGIKADVELEKITGSVGMDMDKRMFLGISLKLFDSQK